MTEAVRCARCGIRFDGRREKCPRCGERRRLPIADGAPLQWPSARRMAAGIGVVALVAGLGGWLWLTTQATSAAPTTTAGVASPLAAMLRAQDRRPIATPARVPTEIAFVDSPAAGRRDYDMGNLETALAHFQEQMAAEPSNAESYSNAGQVLIRLGRSTEALPLLEKATDLDPNRWAYRFNLARARGLLGQWDRAAQDYAEANRLFSGDYATLFNLGQALHRAGREQEAVARYREAIQQKPDDSSFYLALGTSEEKLGHPAEAAAAYRRFVEMDPSAHQAAAVAARAKQLETSKPPALAAAPAANAEPM